MPKSKKNKIVHLTQVKKKTKNHKEDLIKQCEQYATTFKRVFLFDFDSVKSDKIMRLRLKMNDIGRIFSGKNSLMSLALRQVGSKSDIDYDNLIEQIAGHRGLLFTDVDKNKLVSILDKEEPEFCPKLVGFANINLVKSKVPKEADEAPVGTVAAIESDQTGKNRKKTAQMQKQLTDKIIKGKKKSVVSKKAATYEVSEKTSQTKKATKKRQIQFVKI